MLTLHRRCELRPGPRFAERRGNEPGAASGPAPARIHSGSAVCTWRNPVRRNGSMSDSAGQLLNKIGSVSFAHAVSQLRPEGLRVRLVVPRAPPTHWSATTATPERR